jgi:prophage DNA circulation protein
MTGTPLASQVGFVAVTEFVTADFVNLCVALARDELTLVNAVAGLVPPPNTTYGRYANGALTAQFSGLTTVAQAIARVTTARTAVEDAAAALLALGGATTGPDYPGAVVALLEALRAAATNPSDAVRLMAAAASYQANALTGLPGFFLTVLFRRSALISMARACASYQPASYQDAAAVLVQATALFDLEIEAAADVWDAASFAALRTLRTDVVDDLTTRAAQVPILVTVTTNVPLPAAVQAYRLYGDATRADGLIQQAAPINPLFLPTTMTVLSQ